MDFWGLIFFFLLLQCSNGIFNKTIAQNKFENDFLDKCSKYNFVKNYLRNIQVKVKDEKFVIFVFHEKNFRNGGLGDRLGGLISAFGISLRFNRTFFVQSSNSLHKLFRPYVPTNHSIINYSNFSSFSNFHVGKRSKLNSEYELWQCINNADEYNSECGMERGDVRHKILKIRSNRAYLCKWSKSKLNSLQWEMNNLLGIGKDSDLFEAAGCMLRLALWPTEKLWSAVELMYKHFEKKTIQKKVSKTKSIKVKKREEKEFFQVGMHFRCGDKSYLLSDGGYDRACEHDERGDDPHEETSYMGGGTPVVIAKCALTVFKNESDFFYNSLLLNKTIGL
jgi:hypothetical protein